MSQLIKPVLGFDTERKTITVKLEVDYRVNFEIDIELLFDVLKDANRLILITIDNSGTRKLSLDLTGAVVAKDDINLIIYSSNQSCLLIGRDGTIIATPYCKSPFSPGES